MTDNKILHIFVDPRSGKLIWDLYACSLDPKVFLHKVFVMMISQVHACLNGLSQDLNFTFK